MPEYTYPYIFPDLQNPRDLETWLGANVVNATEGSALYAASSHQHADALRVNSVLTDGGSLLTSEGDLTYVEVTEGVPAGADLLVDVTVTVEAANVPAGAYWGARIGVQDVAQGSLLYHQGQAHAHSVSVTTSASGSSSTDGAHTHGLSGTADSESISHRHMGGTLATPAGGTTVTGAASATSHSHDSGSYKVAKSPEYWDVAGTSSSGGVGHTHAIAQHAHDVGGLTDYGGGSHSHGLSAGSANTTGSTHSHTVSTTGSGSGSTGSGGGGLSKDTITVRHVGTVNTGEGAIKIAARGVCTSAGATWTKVAVVGVVWIVPTVLASQLGGLDDLADVSAPSPADSQVLTWSAGASAWIAQDVNAAAGSNFAAQFLLMGG